MLGTGMDGLWHLAVPEAALTVLLSEEYQRRVLLDCLAELAPLLDDLRASRARSQPASGTGNESPASPFLTAGVVQGKPQIPLSLIVATSRSARAARSARGGPEAQRREVDGAVAPASPFLTAAPAADKREAPAGSGWHLSAAADRHRGNNPRLSRDTPAARAGVAALLRFERDAGPVAGGPGDNGGAANAPAAETRSLPDDPNVARDVSEGAAKPAAGDDATTQCPSPATDVQPLLGPADEAPAARGPGEPSSTAEATRAQPPRRRLGMSLLAEVEATRAALRAKLHVDAESASSPAASLSRAATPLTKDAMGTRAAEGRGRAEGSEAAGRGSAGAWPGVGRFGSRAPSRDRSGGDLCGPGGPGAGGAGVGARDGAAVAESSARGGVAGGVRGGGGGGARVGGHDSRGAAAGAGPSPGAPRGLDGAGCDGAFEWGGGAAAGGRAGGAQRGRGAAQRAVVVRAGLHCSTAARASGPDGPDVHGAVRRSAHDGGGDDARGGGGAAAGGSAAPGVPVPAVGGRRGRDSHRAAPGGRRCATGAGCGDRSLALLPRTTRGAVLRVVLLWRRADGRGVRGDAFGRERGAVRGARGGVGRDRDAVGGRRDGDQRRGGRGVRAGAGKPAQGPRPRLAPECRRRPAAERPGCDGGCGGCACGGQRGRWGASRGRGQPAAGDMRGGRECPRRLAGRGGRARVPGRAGDFAQRRGRGARVGAGRDAARGRGREDREQRGPGHPRAGPRGRPREPRGVVLRQPGRRRVGVGRRPGAGMHAGAAREQLHARARRPCGGTAASAERGAWARGGPDRRQGGRVAPAAAAVRHDWRAGDAAHAGAVAGRARGLTGSERSCQRVVVECCVGAPPPR